MFCFFKKSFDDFRFSVKIKTGSRCLLATFNVVSLVDPSPSTASLLGGSHHWLPISTAPTSTSLLDRQLPMTTTVQGFHSGHDEDHAYGCALLFRSKRRERGTHASSHDHLHTLHGTLPTSSSSCHLCPRIPPATPLFNPSSSSAISTQKLGEDVTGGLGKHTQIIKICPYGCERACQSARAFGDVVVAVCRCVCAGYFFDFEKVFKKKNS